MTPELLRETLKEVLYGPSVSAGLGAGLFSAPGAGLLRAAHAFTFQQAVTPAAPDRPTPAQIVTHVREHLEHTCALLHDPYALQPDGPDAWASGSSHGAALNETQWRAELVCAAQAGQQLYDALYLPLNTDAVRLAHAGIVHAAYHAGALRFHLGNVQAR